MKSNTKYYVGYYRNKVCCMGTAKYEIDTYFQSHRGLHRDDYSVFVYHSGEGYLETSAKINLLLQEDYLLEYQYGIFLPARELEWIKQDVEQDITELAEGTIPGLLMMEHAMQGTSNKFMKQLNALETLLDFFYNVSDKEMDKMRKNLIQSHPLVYMNMEEFQCAERRYLELEELDRLYRERLEE